LVGSKFSPSRASEITQTISNFMPGVQFQFEWPDRLTRSKQGKLVQVIQEQ
jgi:hypothetical protein